MIRFEGDRSLPLAPAAAWSKLSDASFLVECVPDGTPKEGATAARADCKVRPGFAFVRGSMDVTIEVAEAAEPKSIRLKLTSKGIGSSSEVAAFLDLSERDGSTHLHWVAEVVQLGGLLKAVPTGLIRGAAQKVIDDLWRRVSQKLVISPAS
jgi:uncharacterized protein